MPSVSPTIASSTGPSIEPTSSPEATPSAAPSEVPTDPPQFEPLDQPDSSTCDISIELEGCISSSSATTSQVCIGSDGGTTSCDCDGRPRSIDLELLQDIEEDIYVDAGCGEFTFQAPNDQGKIISINCEKFDAKMRFCRQTSTRRGLKKGGSGGELCGDGSIALEVLHSSCSVPIVVGAPAPKDDPKGDPSPYFLVKSFLETEGRVVKPAVETFDVECILPKSITARAGDVASGAPHSLRNRRRAGVIGTDVTTTYQCQYKVTNIGKTEVTLASKDTTSIDPTILGSNEKSTFVLDYNPNARSCPDVTVSATTDGGGCTSVATWSSSASNDG